MKRADNRKETGNTYAVAVNLLPSRLKHAVLPCTSLECGDSNSGALRKTKLPSGFINLMSLATHLTKKRWSRNATALEEGCFAPPQSPVDGLASSIRCRVESAPPEGLGRLLSVCGLFSFVDDGTCFLNDRRERQRAK